jgi:TetR/AcrR family transcriptional regulator, regulator of cefoperazone and chloramphenicol sensitivity
MIKEEAKVDLETVKTKQRLLEAAGVVFAEHGYKNATVRDICKRAGANVAAVNYHFGDKQGLYSETLRYWIRESLAKYPPNLGVDESATPQQKLHAYVRSFFWRIFDEGRPSWYGKLMAREMVDPTHALDSCAKETMRPIADLLRNIIRELLPNISEDQLRRCSCSIVGQIVFYHHCRPAIDKVFPGQRFSPEEVEKLADHVTRFSLAALKEIPSKVD